ncbi:MAG: ABC transporter ATP-binding protein, partial [Acidimicrobiia bacterium]
NPTRPVGRQIAAVIEHHQGGIGPARARGRAIELMERVGIFSPGRAFNRYPHEFSGGQKQRIVIAMAVANRPRLLIADEPTSSLDVLVQETVLELLRELRETFGMALVLISHDLRIVSRVSERTMVMYGGRLVEFGQTRAVLDTPRHWYTLALLRAVPGLDRRGAGGGPSEAIKGNPPSADQHFPGCPFAPRCPRADRMCREEPPPFAEYKEAAGYQRAACWYPVGSEAGSRAGGTR